MVGGTTTAVQLQLQCIEIKNCEPHTTTVFVQSVGFCSLTNSNRRRLCFSHFIYAIDNKQIQIQTVGTIGIIIIILPVRVAGLSSGRELWTSE